MDFLEISNIVQQYEYYAIYKLTVPVVVSLQSSIKIYPSKRFRSKDNPKSIVNKRVSVYRLILTGLLMFLLSV